MKSQCSMKIRAAVQGDDRAIAEMVEVVNAYIMPFEIFQNEEDMKLHLEGLVLLPTYLQQGQFRRLSLFRVDD